MIGSLTDDLLHLFYPRLCIACHERAVTSDEVICILCESELITTDYHLIHPNECYDRMAGALNFAFCSSMYRYYSGGRTQYMVHQIKYKGQTHAAVKLGIRYGKLLMEQSLLDDLSLILPVPLHKRKLRKRGFNQSNFFAKGLSESMSIPWSPKFLVRKTFTETQTAKNRLERIKNMENAFQVIKSDHLENRHILLVDDVLTTGATIAACAEVLLRVKGVRISAATIALAE